MSGKTDKFNDSRRLPDRTQKKKLYSMRYNT